MMIVKWLQDNVEWVFSGIGHWILGGILSVAVVLCRIFFKKRQKNAGIKADKGSVAFGDKAKENTVTINYNTPKDKDDA